MSIVGSDLMGVRVEVISYPSNYAGPRPVYARVRAVGYERSYFRLLLENEESGKLFDLAAVDVRIVPKEIPEDLNIEKGYEVGEGFTMKVEPRHEQKSEQIQVKV